METEEIELAKEIVKQVENDDQLPEKYRIEAFKLLLQYKLGLGVSTIQAGKRVPSVIGTIGEEMSFSEFLNQLEEPKQIHKNSLQLLTSLKQVEKISVLHKRIL